MANRLIGLKNIHIAKLNEDGNYETPVRLAGAKSLNTTNNSTETSFYSDDIMDFYSKGITSMEVEIELAYLDAKIEALITGKKFDETTGALISSSNDQAPTFALLYEASTLQEPIRRVIYECILSRDEFSSSTKTDSISEQTIKLIGKAKPREADGVFDLLLDKNKTEVKATAWNNFFTTVMQPAGSSVLAESKTAK